LISQPKLLAKFRVIVQIYFEARQSDRRDPAAAVICAEAIRRASWRNCGTISGKPSTILSA
jgi:hypothetical protein